MLVGGELPPSHLCALCPGCDEFLPIPGSVELSKCAPCNLTAITARDSSLPDRGPSKPLEIWNQNSHPVCFPSGFGAHSSASTLVRNLLYQLTATHLRVRKNVFTYTQFAHLIPFVSRKSITMCITAREQHFWQILQGNTSKSILIYILTISLEYISLFTSLKVKTTPADHTKRQITVCMHARTDQNASENMLSFLVDQAPQCGKCKYITASPCAQNTK